MVITRVAPLSAAKIAGVLYVVIGLVAGAVVSMAAMIGAFAPRGDEDAFAGALLGVGSIVVLPIFYGCLGFFGTLLLAWIFNVATGMVGGVEIDVK